MVQYEDRQTFDPSRPSQFPQEYGNLSEVLTFQVVGHTIYIPTHLFKHSISFLKGTLIKETKEAVDSWINLINANSPSLGTFDVVFSSIIYGRLDAVQLVGINTDQRKYESLTSAGDDREDFRTVKLDHAVMVDSMELSMVMYAKGVLTMIRKEFGAEFGDVILTGKQIERMVNKKDAAGPSLLDWVFLFRSSRSRSTKVTKMHDRAIKDALNQIEGFRDFISESLQDYKDNSDPKVLEVKYSVEAWFVDRAKKQNGGDKSQLRKGALNDQEQGALAVEDFDDPDAEGQHAANRGVNVNVTSEGTGEPNTGVEFFPESVETVAQVPESVRVSDENVASIFHDPRPTASAPILYDDNSTSDLDSGEMPQKDVTAPSQDAEPGKLMLKLSMPKARLATDNEEPPPTPQASSAAGKQAAQNADRNAVVQPNTTSAPARSRGRGRGRYGARKAAKEEAKKGNQNKRSAPAPQSDEPEQDTARPSAKKTKTNNDASSEVLQAPTIGAQPVPENWSKSTIGVPSSSTEALAPASKLPTEMPKQPQQSSQAPAAPLSRPALKALSNAASFKTQAQVLEGIGIAAAKQQKTISQKGKTNSAPPTTTPNNTAEPDTPLAPELFNDPQQYVKDHAAMVKKAAGELNEPTTAEGGNASIAPPTFAIKKAPVPGAKPGRSILKKTAATLHYTPPIIATPSEYLTPQELAIKRAAILEARNARVEGDHAPEQQETAGGSVTAGTAAPTTAAVEPSAGEQPEVNKEKGKEVPRKTKTHTQAVTQEATAQAVTDTSTSITHAAGLLAAAAQDMQAATTARPPQTSVADTATTQASTATAQQVPTIATAQIAQTAPTSTTAQAAQPGAAPTNPQATQPGAAPPALRRSTRKNRGQAAARYGG